MTPSEKAERKAREGENPPHRWRQGIRHEGEERSRKTPLVSEDKKGRMQEMSTKARQAGGLDGLLGAALRGVVWSRESNQLASCHLS